MDYNFVTNLKTCFDYVQDNPPLLYYSHLPSAIAAIFLGFFVFIKSRNLVGRILLTISLLFSFWVLLNLIVWTSYDSGKIMFSWSVLGIISASLSSFCAYFVYVFIKKKDISLVWKTIIVTLVLPIVFFAPTNFNLENFNVIDCESVENAYYVNYYYGIGFLAFIWILVFSFISYYKEEEKGFKKQILLLTIGIEFFLIFFFFAQFLTGYLVNNGYVENYDLEQYGLFGMTFFMGVLAFMIVKFRAFDIKLIGAQALVVSLIVLIGSMFAFVTTTTQQILVGVTLALSLGMGWALVKSVKVEVQRKEELQVMSGKLSEANDQLRKLDNSKSEFISIASHQLRTPLTAIKGFISMLLEGSYGPIDQKQQDVLNKVYVSNERLVNLVEDLLNISRMESGRMEFKFAPWQVVDICQEVVDTFIPRAKDSNLSLTYQKPEILLPEIMIDGTKVREVISNLVDNALKYTPKGGVTLKVEQVMDAIRVTVSDTGIGVPVTELPYLFAKFSRGKDISRLNTGGTGLGLYVGRSMIENNGGKIWAESDGEGKGSRFIIELPVVQSEELMNRWG